MPPKSASSKRSAAGNEWSSPRKSQAARNDGRSDDDRRREYSSYAPDVDADLDRRRSYSLSLPGMETEWREQPVQNTYSTQIANLPKGSLQGDNNHHPNHGNPPAMPGANAQSAGDPQWLANELDAANGEEAVPIGRETATEFDPHAVWRMVLSELALQMPSSTYDTWVRDTVVIGYEDGEFIIGMPNAYARDWLENRLRHTIKRTLSSIMHRAVQIQFRVRSRPVQDQMRAAAP